MTGKIYDLIRSSSTTRRDIVPLYAELIRLEMKEPGQNVALVNRLILAKWPGSGLEFIKTHAWRLIEGDTKAWRRDGKAKA